MTNETDKLPHSTAHRPTPSATPEQAPTTEALTAQPNEAHGTVQRQKSARLGHQRRAASKPEEQRGLLTWLGVATNFAVVIGLGIAIAQLSQSNHQAKINYTLDFVRELETRAFEDTYRRAIDWFSKHPEAVEWPSRDEMETAGDINHVLNRYSSLAAFYDRDVLDRTVIDTTVGLQVPKFYQASESLLKAKAVPGYDQLAAFCVTMERIARETE